MPQQSAPIRQPRGPSANPSADSFAPPSLSPPEADSDASVRRSNTIGSGPTRHQPSASISASAAASGAFHGGKYRPGTGNGRFRSGSLSNQNGSGNAVEGGASLSRRPSGREVEVVHEDQEREGTMSEGLARQNSLPSRRGESTVLSNIRK